MKRLAIVLGLFACKSSSDQKPEPPPAPAPDAAPVAKAPPPVPPDAAPAPAMDPVTVNPDLKQMIADVVANCTIDSGWLVTDCKNGELDKISAWAEQADIDPRSGELVGRDDFYASLGELGVSSNDPKTLRAVMAAASTVGIGSGKDWLTRNATKAAAQRWLKLAATLPDDASAVSGMAGAIPLMAGQLDGLVAVIGKRADGDLKGNLIMSLAGYGFASALPALTDLVKNEKDPKMQWDAVWSVGGALAPPENPAAATIVPSDADKTKLCDWAKGYLADPASNVSDTAAMVLGYCGGAYIDGALDSLGARLAKGKLDDSMASALAAQCASDSGGQPHGTPEQCKKALALLEQGAQQPGLTSDDLNSAIYALQEVAKVGCTDAACIKDFNAVMTKLGKNP